MEKYWREKKVFSQKVCSRNYEYGRGLKNAGAPALYAKTLQLRNGGKRRGNVCERAVLRYTPNRRHRGREHFKTKPVPFSDLINN